MFFEIQNPARYHAAIYIRLSREDESEGPSQSVTNQKSLLEEFTAKHHLEVFDTYIDDGWSGTNFDRPAFQRMLGDIEAGKVNMVLTKDLSRLGRDYILTGHYMERYFPERQVRYISLLDGIDTGVDSTANDITPFRAIMNDMYAKDISKKIKSVKRDKQRKGLFIGGKPMYGYKKHPTEKNQIVIDEEAAQVVRRMFSMALEGMSCRKIAQKLNEEKVPTPASYCGWSVRRPGPYAGLWSGERVSEMLRNETYLGSMVQGRSVKVSYKSKRCLRQPREDWVVVEHTHAPLVSEETFRKVGLLLESRRRTRSRTYDFPLKGLIFCHECGSPMAVLNRPPVSGEDRLFFVCRTYQRFPKAGKCTCHCVKERTVNEAVMAWLRGQWERALDVERLQSMAEEALKRAEQENRREQERRNLQLKADALTAGLDRMYMDRLSGLLTAEDFNRLSQKLQADRAAIEEKIQKMKVEVKPTPSWAQAETLVRDFLDAAPRSREVLVSLLERIELTRDKNIIIRCRFPNPEAAVNSPDRLQ